jgi:hypothetical protein
MRTWALLLIGVVIVTLGVRLATGSGGADEPTTRPKAPLAPIAVGQVAPRFELKDQDGRLVAVGGPSTGWTVVSFFREANSPW